MAAIDISNVVKKYKGLWVGFKEDQKTVVASGKTVASVMKKADKKGIKQPILFRIPTKIIPYVGSNW